MMRDMSSMYTTSDQHGSFSLIDVGEFAHLIKRRAASLEDVVSRRSIFFLDVVLSGATGA